MINARPGGLVSRRRLACDSAVRSRVSERPSARSRLRLMVVYRRTSVANSCRSPDRRSRRFRATRLPNVRCTRPRTVVLSPVGVEVGGVGCKWRAEAELRANSSGLHQRRPFGPQQHFEKICIRNRLRTVGRLCAESNSRQSHGECSSTNNCRYFDKMKAAGQYCSLLIEPTAGGYRRQSGEAQRAAVRSSAGV